MKNLIALISLVAVTGCTTIPDNECFVAYPTGHEIPNRGLVIDVTDDCEMVVIDQWANKIYIRH